MSDYKDSTGTDKHVTHIPAVYTGLSYSLGDHQTVRCTYIAENPFFFSEEVEDADLLDMAIDDELYMHPDDAEFMESFQELKDKVMAYENFANRFIEGEDYTIQTALAFEDNFNSMTSETVEVQDIAIAETILQSSRYGRALLDFAWEKGIRLTTSFETETARFDRKAKTIFVHGSLDVMDQVLLAARELRRVWQSYNGSAIDAVALHPDHGVLLNRLQYIDRLNAQIRVGWELQLNTIEDIWERLNQFEIGDLLRAFGREAIVDFRSLEDGTAILSLLENWFLSNRCSQVDKEFIRRILSQKDKNFLPEPLSRNVLAEAIEALGSQPYGENALAKHTHLLMSDEVFTEVRDRSSANFLWFVKFEQNVAKYEDRLKDTKGDFIYGLEAKEILNGDNSFQDSQNRVINFPAARAKKDQKSGLRPDTKQKKTSGNNIVMFKPLNA